MAHEHTHDRSFFYIEQVGTIAFSLAFGIAGLEMALDPEKKMLTLLLVPKLHPTVLFCGIALLTLAAIRILTLLTTVLKGRPAPAHAHHHEHAHDEDGGCCHDHDHHEEHEHHEEAGCCGHSEGHGHSLASVGLRYVALLLPVLIFLGGLPNKAMWLARNVDASGISVTDTAGPALGDLHLDFKELDEAASSKIKREFYSGHVGRLTGQLTHSQGNERVFSLIRSRMTCCAADVMQIQVFIVAPKPVEIKDTTWVDVAGRIQFQPKPNQPGAYVPVLHMTDIKTIDPPSNPYIY
jgi:hypothetical protein